MQPSLLPPAGRLDRKIEFPHPNEEARAKILQIHSRKMNVNPDVNYDELARSTDDFNAAQLKAVGPGGGGCCSAPYYFPQDGQVCTSQPGRQKGGPL